MKQVIVENPVINSLYREPRCHFRFSKQGITNEIIEGTGEKRKDKKRRSIRHATCGYRPSTSHGSFGRWAFLRSMIRGMQRSRVSDFLQMGDA